MSRLFLTLFGVHLLLGNLCMLPVAYAQETAESHTHTYKEMAMSPVIPMSPADCRSCVVVTLKQAPPLNMHCENGQCVSHAPVTTSGVVQGFSLLDAIAPHAPAAVIASQTVAMIRPSTAAPPPVLYTDTVVLQL